MPEPEPVALVGDLLATQARRAAWPRCWSTPPSATSRSCASSACPIWARWVRVRGADQGRASATLDEPVEVGGATIRPGDASCSTPTARSWSRRERARRGARRPPASAPSASGSSARSSRPARSRTTSTACASASRAHVTRAAPRRRPHRPRRAPHARSPTRACASSSTCSGMEIEAQRGPVRLPARLGRLPALQPQADRGRQAGLGHMALRAWSPEALERRVEAIERDRPRPRLDRRRPRPRARVPLHATRTGT